MGEWEFEANKYRQKKRILKKKVVHYRLEWEKTTEKSDFFGGEISLKVEGWAF